MTDSAAPKTYHHGNLRAELLDTALEQLRAGSAEDLSLRALARAVGVSQTAPYRHFADKGELLAAMATRATATCWRPCARRAIAPRTAPPNSWWVSPTPMWITPPASRNYSS